ncbi:hypothetical protein Ab1vBOLIVR4_gp87 [Agrobacterium phage OLIVR4]|nr:hypothetical protein Ab1vBOLIVR4_gp87 [Agrobacterium phage OLIVR4]
MFYVDVDNFGENAPKLRGWFPTRELAEAHAKSWPDFISERMFIVPGNTLSGVTEPRRGIPPEHMQGSVAKALADHVANSAIEMEREMLSNFSSTVRTWIESGWQPWETAPRDGTYFDAWVEPLNRHEEARRIPHVQFCTVFNEFSAHEHGKIDIDDLRNLGTPTHWRPEPEGPKK